MATESRISRRNIVLAGGASALLSAKSEAGFAATRPSRGDGTQSSGNAEPDGSPIPTTIASAPVSGYIYRTVCMYDFEPFDPAAQKTWGGEGVYSATTTSTMRASVEIPPGALVREVEYYIYNSSGGNVLPDTYLYVAGLGTIASIGGSVSMPSNGTVSAGRAVIDASTQGPYPFASRLLVSVSTPTNGSVQINGARVGFSNGGGALGVLATPLRIYTSTTRFTAGEIRTLALPAKLGLAGVAAAVLNVTATLATKPGSLKIWSANESAPPSASLHYGVGSDVSGEVTTGVDGGRHIKVQATAPVQVRVDLVALIS